MYNKKNVNYVSLLWEDFMYQADNRDISSARKEHMPYPRFTKVIINHFISKENTISMRNRINIHTIRDDSLLGTLKFVSKTQDYQQYGALIPDDMIKQDIKDFNAYKTYYEFATGKVPPRKSKRYKKVASPPRKLSPVKEAEPVKKGKRVKRHAKMSTTAPTAGVVLRDTLAAQLKEATKKSKKYFHISQASGSGDGTDLISGVPDEKQRKTSSTDEGTDDNDDDSDDNSKGDDDKADSNDDEHDDEYKSDDDNENVFEEKEDDDLYKDVDVRSLGTKHEKERQVVEDAHMTLTASQKTDDSKQSSFVLSDFASKFLILENVPPAVDEVASMMNVKSRREESSTQAPSLFTIPVTAIL
ncbi:hypothetical protein Tco_0845040 [Tanacetum coccineum]